MTQGDLLLDADLEAYFEEVLNETLAMRGREQPDEVVQQYLLGLLADCAYEDEWVKKALAQPLPFLLRDALHADAAVRFERLRRVGDGVLMVSGLYNEHLERMGLSDKYVAAFGSRAYEEASLILAGHGDSWTKERDPSDILLQLATGFREVVDVLRDLSHTLVVRSAKSTADVMRLFERWVHSRSRHLGKMLASKGFVVHPGRMVN